MTRPDSERRALSFGSKAEQYEHHRSGYRHELLDAVLTYAARPVRAALEVGAGTGKATRLFASAGIEVTALEPDALPGRPARPGPGGTVAEVEEQLLPADDPAVVHPWSIEDLTAAEGLTDALRRDLPRTVATTAEEFLGRLGTVSAYLVLGEQARGDASGGSRRSSPTGSRWTRRCSCPGSPRVAGAGGYGRFMALRTRPSTRSHTSPLPSLVAATGLVGGFAAGHVTGRRDLAGAVFGVAGAWCAREWARTAGAGQAVGLTAAYIAAMGASHPLAKRTGPWTAVGLATAAFVAAAEGVSRRRA